MKRRALLEYVALGLLAIVIVLVAQAFAVKPFLIPSSSMAATLRPEDRVLVNRLAYQFHGPRRGDVVVIDSVAKGCVVIKRVVGLPGDRLSLEAGAVCVDGRRLSEPYVARLGGRPEATEPFAGTGRAWSLEKPYIVPAGHYFVLGDNRSVSDDSRDWGPVAAREIVGEAFCTYWPLSRLRGL
jgi:signal peptidase I